MRAPRLAHVGAVATVVLIAVSAAPAFAAGQVPDGLATWVDSNVPDVHALLERVGPSTIKNLSSATRRKMSPRHHTATLKTNK